MSTAAASIHRTLREALDQHRDQVVDDDYLATRVSEIFTRDGDWRYSETTGLPDSPVWDYIEGRLSSRRDLLMRLRGAVRHQ